MTKATANFQSKLAYY